MRTYYDILGVSPGAKAEEIKRAYRQLIKLYHPDRNPGEEAAGITREINEAYSVLKDPVKRVEYDNLLTLSSESEREHVYSREDEAQQSYSEVPHYCCDKCGRQDSTLRVSVFLWVVSLFIVTFKRGWAAILCSRCRIKYSLLFNLEVFFLGWWGFPWGPIFSLEALFKNLVGGTKPAENNAALLGVLSYDLYQQGRYAEAYEAVSESARLRPNREADDFRDYLRSHHFPKRRRSALNKALRASPAWYNVPLLILLATLSFVLLNSSIETSSSDYYSKYSSSQARQSRKRGSQEKELSHLLSSAGINMAEVEESVDACNRAIGMIATYLVSNLPITDTTVQGTTTIHWYELDRSRLEADSVQKNTRLIAAQLARVYPVLADLRNLPPPPAGSAKENAGAVQYLETQLDFMTSSYFNAKMLELSIRFVNGFYLHQRIAADDQKSLRDLAEHPSVSSWLRHTEYSSRYDNLIRIIQSVSENQEKLTHIEERLNWLEKTIDNDQESLDQMQTRLAYYERSGSHYQYNQLVDVYNDRLLSAQSRIDQYNSLAGEYDQLIGDIAAMDIDEAFNSCLDPDILRSEFEYVDIHPNQTSPSTNQR